MDHLRRLVAGFVLALFVCSVFAATCTPHTETQYRFSFTGRVDAGVTRPTQYTDWNPSAASSCAAASGLYNSEFTYTTTPISGNYAITVYNSTAVWSGTTCQIGGTRTTQSCHVGSNPECGAASTNPTSGTHTTNTRSVVIDCAATCQAKQGTSAGTGSLSVPGKAVPSALCLGSCEAKLGSGGGGGVAGCLNGVCNIEVPASNYTFSGADCTGTGGTPQAGPAACPEKQCPGTVNGASVCVPCDSVSTTDKNTTAPPGTAASAANGAASAPGAVSTGTTTTCTNGVCTTTRTVTTTGSDGKTTTTTDGGTTEQSQDSFCAANPSSDLCSDSQSSFTGACAATQCSGDAVICAIAQEQQKRNCELFNENSGSALGRAAQANGDAGAIDHPYRNGTSTSLATMIDKTNILGGSCPADMSVPVGARSVSLPFSQLCTPATWLGNILVGLTALSCIGIVFVRGS